MFIRQAGLIRLGVPGHHAKNPLPAYLFLRGVFGAAVTFS
jgi:hypothetical protein